MDKHEKSQHRPGAALLPVMGVVFVAFLVIGLAMPVLPLHVHQGLHFGTFVVGLVAGSQFGASLVSRPWAGNFADRRGPKRAIILGLLVAAISGILYLLSLGYLGTPAISVAILLLGRALLGAAESVIITGAVTWGLALVRPESTGKVIAWMGAAMFGAFALGAPIGALLYDSYGFTAIALATALAPLATLLLALPLRRVAPLPRNRASFLQVIGAVFLPGIGSALASLGFGAITAFVVLLFAQHGWTRGWLAYTAFAAAFIATRLILGDLADKLGGARIALFSVLIEAAGLALIWQATRPELALAGALVTGIGYALVYPGLGIEAVRRVPPQNRGLAMAAYTAFLDLALGLGTPALGLVAGSAELGTVFLASALAALAGAAVAARLWLAPSLSGARRARRGEGLSCGVTR